MNKDLLEVVSLFETVHAAAGINQLLFPRKERMAFGANIYLKLFLDGTRYKSFAASTFYRTFTILGMYSFFHYSHPFAKKVAIVIIA